jgi:penicillin-binding protein 2
VQFPGAAVALDVNTGEVLVLASKPDYNLNELSPRFSTALAAEIESKGAWLNRAISGVYQPGSTFKLITALAGLRSGVLTPDSAYTTNGTYLVGNHAFHDHGGCPTGEFDLRAAIEQSVNTYFINFGLQIGVDAIAAEAHRFHLDERTGIELPGRNQRHADRHSRLEKETVQRRLAARRHGQHGVRPGLCRRDAARMACFMASLARGQTYTKPTLLHVEGRAPQRSEPIGISAENYRALLEGMERAVTQGTARRGAVARPAFRRQNRHGPARSLRERPAQGQSRAGVVRGLRAHRPAGDCVRGRSSKATSPTKVSPAVSTPRP